MRIPLPKDFSEKYCKQLLFHTVYLEGFKHMQQLTPPHIYLLSGLQASNIAFSRSGTNLIFNH